MSKVQSITSAYVSDLIDFAPTAEIKTAGIDKLQRDGCVALFNMLVTNGIAYLADEVGMGKTYIGLAVMSLLRYQKPNARVLIVTPGRSIQEKWSSDLQNFVRDNWRRADHRVKTPQGSPDFPTRLPNRLADWLNDLHDQSIGAHDTILRMSSFSLGVAEDNGGSELRRFIELTQEPQRRYFSKLDSDSTSRKTFAEAFRSAMGDISYDLIIVDEAHNLKYGFDPSRNDSSIRNEVMYYLFGHDRKFAGVEPWLLMLSATPFENGNPETLVRQLEVFGRNQAVLRSAPTSDLPVVSVLQLAPGGASRDLTREQIKSNQKRLIVRRVGVLRLQDDYAMTRNMYRREWRAGGLEDAEKPMKKAGGAIRLVNAVLQKNVFDMIQGKSGGRFRIGALESFEIYSGRPSHITDLEPGNQAADDKAPDQHVIARLSESFRAEFNQEVPHPKLNAVSGYLKQHLLAREKALVFVRRVATTWDLATRVSRDFDDELITKIRQCVHSEDLEYFDELAAAWKHMCSSRDFSADISTAEAGGQEDALRLAEAIESEAGEDASDDGLALKESVPSFFTWFFRGLQRNMTGFKNTYSGRRLREQLGTGSRLSLVFEENYVDWVLGRPASVLSRMSELCGKPDEEVLREITENFPITVDSDKNSRRLYHAIQCAALRWLSAQDFGGVGSENIDMLSDEIYAEARGYRTNEHSIDLKIMRELLEIKGLYSHLARVPQHALLSGPLFSDLCHDCEAAGAAGFRETLRRREQVRLWQMAAVRHGAPFIDLYLAALKCRSGAFRYAEGQLPPPVSLISEGLAAFWSDCAAEPGRWRSSGAWELAEIRQNFDLLRKLNVPSIDRLDDRTRPLDFFFVDDHEQASGHSDRFYTARRLLNAEMAGQAPTAAAQGGQGDERRHRITCHFRMPGMPWVLVATSVYEEGVDLHTYCKTVVHHGISHTASSVEQRTGRVDRIGGQVQRLAAQCEGRSSFSDDLKIQSLFPYQSDTFEKHQVRKVLRHCNHFLNSLRDNDAPRIEDRHSDVTDTQDLPEQVTDFLRSPFDVAESNWLLGYLQEPDRRSDFDESRYFESIRAFEVLLRSAWPGINVPKAQGLERHYELGEQQIHVAPRSQREGDQMEMELGVKIGDLELNSSRFVSGARGADWQEEAMRRLASMITS